MGLSVSLGYTLQDLTRRLATLRNIAEQLIDKGLASVVRHKRDDEDRSPEFDKFVAAEQAYVVFFELILISPFPRYAGADGLDFSRLKCC